MPILQATDPDASPVPDIGSDLIPHGLPVSQELDVMVGVIKRLSPDRPDSSIAVCMAFMARCTELHLTLVRQEAMNRRAKVTRTMELEPVMQLIEFTYKAASRIVEIRRQDAGMSK